MAIKPILFSTPMVQAILANRKNQTRRTQGLEGIRLASDEFIDRCDGWPKQGDFAIKVKIGSDPDRYEIKRMLKNKYSVGDILWVRESLKVGAWNHSREAVAFDYKASPELVKTPWVYFQTHDEFDELHERTLEELARLCIQPIVDEENECFYFRWEPGQSPLRWKPSIHMPKIAARIFLEVTNVRVERLYSITAADAIAEGIEGSKTKGYKNYMVKGARTGPQVSFETLWILINGKKSFDENPWVWVYEFKRIEKPDNWPNS